MQNIQRPPRLRLREESSALTPLEAYVLNLLILACTKRNPLAIETIPLPASLAREIAEGNDSLVLLDTVQQSVNGFG